MKNSTRHILTYSIAVVVIACLAGCSSTSHLDEGEQLYTGMKKTVYKDYESGQHFFDTQEEVEAALACAPNGSLFGSSYLRTPFPYGLWVYNAFSDKKGAIAKWLTKTIGKAPVLMTDVNPELHVSVAKSVLQNNGYFRGNINYRLIDGKTGTTKNDTVPHVLTGKVEYTVNMGPLFTLDSIEYKGFSDNELALINATPSLLKKDDAFSISNLDDERNRIYNAFKNNGYYYFEKSYITYLADTIQVPGHVQLQICKADSLPEDAQKQWKIGTTTFRLRRQIMEQTTDSIQRGPLNVVFAGKKPAVRPRVVLQDIRLRPKKLFSLTELTESQSRLTTKGIFSSTDISFTKSDSSSTDSIGTMDMLVDCVLDKPYDFALSANYTQKSSGRGGPGVSMSFGKRNAFHGGELLSFTLKGNMEFQLGNKVDDRQLNYEMGAEVSLQMPRLLLPNFLRKRRHWFIPPSTMFTLSYNRNNRSGYYRKNIFSSEFSYIFSPTVSSVHTFSPLAISHVRLAYFSDEYLKKVAKSNYGLMSLDDYFIPKMRYTYNYTTKSYHNNPISLSVTLAEAGNITCGLMSLFGKKSHTETQMTIQDSTYTFTEDGYMLFHTNVAQYVRAEFDFVKTWRTGVYSKLLAHVFAGYIHSYGNSDEPPFAELYYAGGANDLRGFSSRGVGPGNFYVPNSDDRYVYSNGNLKFIFNLEYRPRIFGSLYGALFLDAGNVWGTYWNEVEDYYQKEEGIDLSMTPKLKNIPKQIAVDAGVGIRYDLGFFVIRLDWGFIIHSPHIQQSDSGYFNMPSFKKAQCVNFAIGYPF